MNDDNYIVKQQYTFFSMFWNTSLHRTQDDGLIAKFEYSYWSDGGTITLYNNNAEENIYILKKPYGLATLWNVLQSNENIGTMRMTRAYTYDVHLPNIRFDITLNYEGSNFALKSPLAEFNPRRCAFATLADMKRIDNNNNIEDADVMEDEERAFAINFALFVVVLRRRYPIWLRYLCLGA